MPRFIRNNGLSLVLGGLFLAFLIGHSIAGFFAYNNDQVDHGQPQATFGQYLTSGQFLETVGENWESEFLQMLAFVGLTTFPYQRGSPESRDPDKREAVDRDPRTERHGPFTPWPVRRAGVALRL